MPGFCAAKKRRNPMETHGKRGHRLLHPDPKRLCELAHMADEENSTDVLGSYTGMAEDGGRPEQDADDL